MTRFRSISIVLALGIFSLLAGCPGPTQSAVTGDLTGDRVVDQADLDVVAGLFGLTADDEGFDARADLNGDGVIGLEDVQQMQQLVEG